MATALRITAVKHSLACSQCHRYIREGRTIYVIDNQPVCDLCGDPDPAARICGTDRDATIKRIRAALQKRSGRQWSVTGGKGTAWGWIRIDVPPSKRTWHFVESGQRDAYGLPIYEETEDASRNFGHMGPADREELAALLDIQNVHQQGVSIPSGSDYYEEFIDRAEGRTPRRSGTPYWD